MPLYTVKRHFPGATKTDLDAAAFRTLSCLQYHPGLRWLRTYWDAESQTTTCIYEARDPEDIRHHAVRADLPCDEIIQVEEVLPSDYTGAEDGDSAVAAAPGGSGFTDNG